MQNGWPLRFALFFFAILIVAILAWLTSTEAQDPCANPQGDISASVLADTADDQDALVNRAIIMKGNCDKAEGAE
ncbi:MAG: hypothetical protein ACI9JM_001867 [Halioglobus sp.]|jgi:hypothetical protein